LVLDCGVEGLASNGGYDDDVHGGLESVCGMAMEYDGLWDWQDVWIWSSPRCWNVVEEEEIESEVVGKDEVVGGIGDETGSDGVRIGDDAVWESDGLENDVLANYVVAIWIWVNVMGCGWVAFPVVVGGE
jgi:hypothetical protein